MPEKPKIVFDNIIFKLQASGGISKLWSELVKSLDELVTIQYVDDYWNDNIYRIDPHKKSKVLRRKIPLIISRYLNFNRKFFSDKYIFHSSYYRINTDPNCINVVTVHDLMYEKFRSGLSKRIHKFQKSIALKKAHHIVCVSNNTKKDLLEYYPFCSVKNIIVIPNGVGDFVPNLKLSETLKKIELLIDKEPYFLYVGNRGICKGFNHIHDVIDELSINCVVVGSSFNRTELKEIENRNHFNKIVNVGLINHEELNYLYSKANFFFFPSIYEGFGIPPIEAMMSGCPVIASNQSSIPEVVGNAALLFDPYDKESLKKRLEEISNKKIRSQLVKNGFIQAQKYNWQHIINQYSELYCKLT